MEVVVEDKAQSTHTVRSVKQMEQKGHQAQSVAAAALIGKVVAGERSGHQVGSSHYHQELS